MKSLIILRGVPGAGKDTFAALLNGVICSADKYFEGPGGYYNFDPKGLFAAHNFCRKMVESAMFIETEKIIVANTNTREAEMKPYIELAEKYGYQVFSIVIEKRHNGINIHGVPDDKIIEMGNRIKQSIKLY